MEWPDGTELCRAEKDCGSSDSTQLFSVTTQWRRLWKSSARLVPAAKHSTHSKEVILRLASPVKLYSGSWGAWVTGEDVKPGTLIWLRTRNGKSWFSEVNRVLWEGPSKFTGELGAICERMDLALDADRVVSEIVSDFIAQIESTFAQLESRVTKLEENWQGLTVTPVPKLAAIESIPPLNGGYQQGYHQKNARDKEFLTDFVEERIRRQRERIPNQIAGLSDYNRLYGRDSAH